MLSLCVTGNVLRRLHCFHPLVDIFPQIYPSWGTFAEGCTIFQLSTSKRLPLPRYKQWWNLDAYIFQTYSPGGATIGSPTCSGILTTARFLVGSSPVRVMATVAYLEPASFPLYIIGWMWPKGQTSCTTGLWYHAANTQIQCRFQQKLKLTDVEIPPTDDAGAAQPMLLDCELATLDARKSLRRFFPSIISCILATASVAKPHTSLIYTQRQRDTGNLKYKCWLPAYQYPRTITIISHA